MTNFHKFCIIILLAFQYSKSMAQVVGQKLNSGGSIFYEGYSLGTEITDKKITFDFAAKTPLRKTNDKKNKLALMYGLSASGKNNDKLLALFEDGDFSTSSKFGINLGIEIESSKPEELVDLYKSYNSKNDELNKLNKNLDSKLNSYILNSIDQFIASMESSGEEQRDVIRVKKIKENYSSQFNTIYLNYSKKKKANYGTFKNYLTRQTTNKSSDLSKMPKLLQHVKDELDAFTKTYSAELHAIVSIKGERSNLANLIHEIERDLKKNRFIPYLTASLLGDKFKLLDASNAPDRGLTVIDTSHVGGYIGLGCNFETKNIVYGMRYTREFENNFEILSKRTFTSEKVELINGVENKSKNEITAYEGSFHTLHFNRLVLDMMVFCDLGEKYKLAINPFFRHSESSESDLSPNLSDVGVGTYFFDKKTSKFMAGVYLVAPDLSNNEAEFKDEEKKSIFNRLNFGVSATYVFNDFASIYSKNSVRSTQVLE